MSMYMYIVKIERRQPERESIYQYKNESHGP